MKIKWSERSLRNISEILRFTGSELFVAKLIERTLKIPAFPLTGQKLQISGGEGLREVIWQDYRIVYRIEDKVLEIVTVCHVSRILMVD